MKKARETKAGQSISAWVILRGDRKQTEVAKVQAYFADSGGVTVDVFNYGRENPDAEDRRHSQGHAGGYGYDKFNAAISGLSIDGWEMCLHCTKGIKGRKDVRGANWSKELGDWESWFIESDLARLTARGYRVLQAI